MQSYKAIPALCVHTIKKVSSSGPARLHVLRSLDAVVGGSLNKHGSGDKYGVHPHAPNLHQTRTWAHARVSSCR